MNSKRSRIAKSSDLQFFAGLAALIFLLVLAPGCVTREMAGRKIIQAPNQQYPASPLGQLTTLWNHYSPAASNSPFIYLAVEAGPPEATIAAVEFPPQDYHMKFVTRVGAPRRRYLPKSAILAGKGRDGARFMSMNLKPETNNTFTPLKVPATIVILHGYMLSKETMVPWAFTLAQAGYRVVLVDLRGHGQSTGDRVTYGKYETGDLSRMLDYLKAQGLCDERVGVLGLSYGGTLALHWAARDARVQAVVAIAPYNHPEAAAERLAKELKIPVSHKTLTNALALAAERLEIKWVDWSGETAVRHMKQPVLLIGGGRDRIGTPADIELLKKAAPTGTKSIQIADANHFAVGFWLHELAAPVEAWFGEHLETAADPNAKIVMREGKPVPTVN